MLLFHPPLQVRPLLVVERGVDAIVIYKILKVPTRSFFFFQKPINLGNFKRLSNFRNTKPTGEL